MAEWVNITVGRYLTVEIMNSIYENFLYISNKMSAAGHAIPTLSDCRVTYAISQADILGKFNSVEENINKFHELANYPDIYYASTFKWNTDTDMGEYLQSGIKRWINWLNDAKKHCDCEFESLYLTDKNGKNITDKNGNQILVFKEW